MKFKKGRTPWNKGKKTGIAPWLGKKRPDMTGDKHPRWKGKITDEYGYILVHVKSHPNKDSKNYVKEHRLVMEKYLGRYLKSKEVVHHIDHNKQNNNIENLYLFKNDSEHQKYHNFLGKLVYNELIKSGQIYNGFNGFKGVI